MFRTFHRLVRASVASGTAAPAARSTAGCPSVSSCRAPSKSRRDRARSGRTTVALVRQLPTLDTAAYAVADEVQRQQLIRLFQYAYTPSIELKT